MNLRQAAKSFLPPIFVDTIKLVKSKNAKNTLQQLFTNLDAIAKRFGGQRFYCHLMCKGEKL